MKYKNKQKNNRNLLDKYISIEKKNNNRDNNNRISYNKHRYDRLFSYYTKGYWYRVNCT